MTGPRRGDGRLTVALIREVFWEPDGVARLRDRLDAAADRGADLAVLPELALIPWRPATNHAIDGDAEPMGGPRARVQADAARESGIGLVGGIIHRDAATGRRTNRTLVFDRSGGLVAFYDKLHLPSEPGYWETSHYEPGASAPRPIDAFGLPLGVQVCSDSYRPEGAHVLAAEGVEAILVPRATEEATYERWNLVFRATALTSCAYVLSVTRPQPEGGVPLGGPSVAIEPNGEILLETVEPVAVVTLESRVVEEARRTYPGYLPVRARLYADAWASVARSHPLRPAGKQE